MTWRLAARGWPRGAGLPTMRRHPRGPSRATARLERMRQPENLNLLVSCESQAGLEALLAPFREAGHVTRAPRVSSLRDLGDLLRDAPWEVLLADDPPPEPRPAEALPPHPAPSSGPCMPPKDPPRPHSRPIHPRPPTKAITKAILPKAPKPNNARRSTSKSSSTLVRCGGPSTGIRPTMPTAMGGPRPRRGSGP